MLFKEIVDARTHARTHDGRRTLKDHKSAHFFKKLQYTLIDISTHEKGRYILANVEIERTDARTTDDEH